MFHDMGLTKVYRSATERFEIDSANAAREFLRQHGISQASIDIVWDAIALHTTPGIPQHKEPEVALVTTTFGTVNDDVLALLDPKFKRTNFCNIILTQPGVHKSSSTPNIRYLLEFY